MLGHKPMNNPLEKITETGKSALRIIKAVGPLLISQSKKASESFSEHQFRLAKVDVAKEFMLKEVESISEARNHLREKFYDANIEDRINIKRDIEETEREIRRLNLVSNALDQLPPPETSERKTEPDLEAEEETISLHWMDKFNEYARAHNEEWRKDLLTKALAMEAKKPRVIGPRALWLIGTIDEYLFHAYASLLDVSTNLAGGYIIPNHQKFNEKPIPNCALGGNKAIGNLVFMLSDLGLIGNVLSSQKQMPGKARFVATYGKKVTLITTKKEIRVKGVILTMLGETISKLYTPKPNELGLEIYNYWLGTINEAEKKTLA